MTATSSPEVLVVLLPAIGNERWPRDAIADGLMSAGLTVEVVPETDPDEFDPGLDASDAWISHCAVSLSNVAPGLPRLLVAYRAAAQWIATVGFATRAAHNSVVGYVLIEGDMPRPGLQDWPDAPVTYLGEREASLAQLRGWQVLPGDDVASSIEQVARGSV